MSDPHRAAGRYADAATLLFDLDGTLTASGPGILASVCYALTEMAEPIPDAEQLHRFIGPPLVDSFRDVCGMDPQRIEVAIATYRVYFAERGQYENRVYDGVPELLGALVEEGRVLAVATSKAEVFAESILIHFGLMEHFTTVVGSHLDGRRTGKADVLAEALHRLDSPATGAVMIGDRSHDVAGARAAGMPCIGVLWGYGDAGELTSAGADLLVATPAELRSVLSS